MSRVSFFTVVSMIVFTATVLADKAERDERRLPIPRIHHERYLDLNPESKIPNPARALAAADTFVVGDFTFDGRFGPDAQGWVGEERHEWFVRDTFFHVADTTELVGGDSGRLIALEGSQSLWCGVSPSATGDQCYYATLPGYGDHWSQQFTSIKFPHSGDVELSFLATWDLEPGYDFTYLSFLNEDGDWEELASYTWRTDVQLESFVIPSTSLGDSVQIQFSFRSDGAESDEDGLWPTDGAIIIDNLRLADTVGVIDFQDFEGEPVGARVTNDGHWYAGTPGTRGNFSGLSHGASVLQEDGCIGNASGLWGFFNGSTDDYSCGGHPEQAVVPLSLNLTNDPTDYISNEIWSPIIDLEQDIHGVPVPETAEAIILEFDVYRDLPLDNLVFYRWAVRGIIDDCPQEWRTNNYVNYSDSGQKGWYRHRVSIAGRVAPGIERVQIALSVVDMCVTWCGIYGDGTCHSHAPLFDNVRLIRIDISGPSWHVPSNYLFQDNFASDGTLTGTVPINGPNLDYQGEPGDEAMVYVTSSVGIDSHIPGDSLSGPAVYCHIKDVSTAKSGSVVSGDLDKYPWILTRGGWTTLQCYSDNTDNQGPQFYIDLNDALYQPGDTVYYYFSMRDKNHVTDYWSIEVGATMSEAEVRANPMEITCLPANALSGATDILYVDGFDGHGAQPFFDTAFEMLGITPDRYDVLDPLNTPASGPGLRVVDVVQQLASVYKTIIWNTGYFGRAGIHDGIGLNAYRPSSDDFGMLFEFLDQSPNRPGVYLSGDNIASWWASRTGTGAVNMRNTYMNFNIVSNAHTDVGEATSPLVIGLPGSCFSSEPTEARRNHRLHRRKRLQRGLIAYGGGCTGVNDFDVLEPFGLAKAAMAYSGDPSKVAVVTQITENSSGDTARVILSGFSFHEIRDQQVGWPPVRVLHLAEVLDWLEKEVGDLDCGVGLVPLPNELAQNCPNPFNASTAIGYSIKETGHVTLKIYTVAGELVKTLVDEPRSPIAGGYAVTWNGRNNLGDPVSSGVYFCRLLAKNFSQTKKMVLLK